MTRLRVKYSKDGYYVYRGSKAVYGPNCMAHAENALDRIRREAKLRDRDCMVCKKTFASEGAHNRLCKICRKRPLFDGAA